MTNPGYGTFGNLGGDYAKARQDFPSEVFDLFAKRLNREADQVVVLDIGCGTGIATRQLAERGYQVSGSDVDADMIRHAQEKGDGIEYCIAPASKLPFPDAAFDAATAFSAFHWFSDADSIKEIRRVLKPNGLFMVVNKNDVAGFKLGYRAVLAQYIDGEVPNVKKNYAPETILVETGFTNVERQGFAAEELYTANEALAYLRSVSLWNLVPETRKAEATAAIEKYCRSEADGNILKRAIEVAVVIGNC